MGDLISELIESVIVDAYGDAEQLSCFVEAFDEHARFPIHAQVVGAEVDVVGVDFDGDERRGLVAVCRREGEQHLISLLDVVPVGPLPLTTRQLLEAYRRWSGAGPLPAPAPPGEAPSSSPGPGTSSWVYPRFASPGIHVAPPPLGLEPCPDWEPATAYWGEPDEPLHPMLVAVLAAGPRPCFEMEQVLPGVDDDLDTDPIVEASDLHRSGQHRAAIRLLEGLLNEDMRCIDAWGHLGLVAFNTRGPGAAAEYYDMAVAVAERALPEDFAGVLPWGLVDNRPFLRALHGLGLCAWRQRRWEDAEAAFTAEVWLAPDQPFDALSCLESVQARIRWSRD